MKVMMACGHAANSTQTLNDGTTRPSCIICLCSEVGVQPDLTDRVARCFYFGVKTRKNECRVCTRDGFCGCYRPSSMDLAFFEYHPDKEFDDFYCGCQSWD